MDVICGSDKPVQPRPVPITAAYPYHQCHNVQRDYCYTIPVIEQEEGTVPKCHVETKADCKDTEIKVDIFENLTWWFCKC